MSRKHCPKLKFFENCSFAPGALTSCTVEGIAYKSVDCVRDTFAILLMVFQGLSEMCEIAWLKLLLKVERWVGMRKNRGWEVEIKEGISGRGIRVIQLES